MSGHSPLPCAGAVTGAPVPGFRLAPYDSTAAACGCGRRPLPQASAPDENCWSVAQRRSSSRHQIMRKPGCACGVVSGARAADPETKQCDFKEPARGAKTTRKVLADDAACFVDAHGGDIVLGIRDNAAGVAAVVGVSAAFAVEAVRREIFDRTRPERTCTAEECTLNGKRIVTATVSPGVTVHANAAGTATRRLGKNCLPFTPQQRRGVLISRGQIDFSAEPTAAGTLCAGPPTRGCRQRRLREVCERLARRPEP